jgi:hypothetical protein
MLYGLFSSPNIVKAIKSENGLGRDHIVDLGVIDRITVKVILEE